MAQVSVQAPANLMEMMRSASPMMWDIARNQVDQQSQANTLNMDQARQSMAFEKQEQPFKLSQLGLANDTTSATLPGIRANAGMLEDKASLSRSTLEKQRSALNSELAGKISTAHLTEAEDFIKTMMAHPTDPKIRAQGQKLYQGLAEIQKEKLKQDAETRRALETENARGKNASDIMQKQIDAGRFKKFDKSSLNMASRIDMETDPGKKQGMLIDAATQAEQAGDSDLAQHYLSRAEALDNAVKLRANTAAKAGGVNIGATAPGIQVNPTPSAMPDKGEINTYKSPEDIKAAYQAGKLTKDQARKLLQQNHGMK